MTEYERKDSRAKWPVRGKDNAPDFHCETNTYPDNPRPWRILAAVLTVLVLVSFLAACCLCCSGCASSKPTERPYYPITNMVDPVTETTPDVIFRR